METSEILANATLTYDDDGNPIVEIVECGHCGRTWNDAAISSLTPTPAGRCPYEDEHEDEEDEDDLLHDSILDPQMSDDGLTAASDKQMEALAKFAKPSSIRAVTGQIVSDDSWLPEPESTRGGTGPYIIPIVDDNYGGVIAWANTLEQAQRIVAALTAIERGN